MADEKIIKCQAYICGNSLVQEQIKLYPYGSTDMTVVLIENIWDDLTSASGTYQVGVKKAGYFYWEYQMTDSEDDNIEVTVHHECPRPKDGLFMPPYDPDAVEGDYAKYWVEKMREASENYEKAAAIQRKEVLLKGTEYFDPVLEGIRTIDDMVETNSNFGDIMSLLNLF